MINKETILLRANNGLDVFRHFIPGDWRPGKNFLNPFYQDKNASCNVYKDKNTGIYKIKDFGDERFTGDCFVLVGLLYNLDCRYAKEFQEILMIIDQELSLGLTAKTEKPIGLLNKRKEKFLQGPKPVIKGEKQSPLTPPVFKEFCEKELSYWQNYGIEPSVLNYFNVRSIETFSAFNKEGKEYTFNSSPGEPIFGYCHKQFIKVYRPLSNIRFLYLGEKLSNYVFGLGQLPTKGDILFITGGEKDVMALYAKGFHAICFNSENATIPLETIKKLSYRFRHITLLYDTDSTGLNASQKHVHELKEFEALRLLLPLPGTKENKDISDFFKQGFEAEDLKNLFLNLLDKLYAETFAMLKSCEIDFNNPPKTPEPLVSINGVTIGSPGNILGITGGEGSGKSNFLGGIVAGGMRMQGDIVDSLGMEVKSNEEGKAILYYDTEQSEDQLYRNLTYIMTRCSRPMPPDWFKAYCLTNMSRKERLQVISQSVDRFHHQFNGIHIIVIDGIGDLIKGLNDEVESVQLIENLHRMAGIYKTCIICVLHMVPSGIKLRGHLGSELQRKSAGILSIEKDTDTDVSYIKALKVRSGSPLDVPLLQFAWDREKQHHVFIGEKSKEDKNKRKIEDLKALAEELFTAKGAYTYTELVHGIEASMEVSERTAKNYIRFMRESNIIVKGGEDQHFLLTKA
jgi:hypothetical protein